MIAPWMWALFAGCEPVSPAPIEPWTVEDLAAEAGEEGDLAVGYRQAEVRYTPEGLNGVERTIPVEVWYPAENVGKPATYLVAGFVQQEAPLALDAPDPFDRSFPVVVYSHGSGGLGLLAYPYAERLASHGFIVLAPDHVGNTTLDLGDDAAPFAYSLLSRPQDVSAVIDAAEDGEIAGLGDADTSAVLVFGHSFGGYTTLALGGAAVDLSAYPCAPGGDDPECSIFLDPDAIEVAASGLGDPRVVALAPQAPALFDYFAEGALEGIAAPTLLQSAGLDRTTPDASEAEPMWAAMDGATDRWLRIPNGGHYSFITVCEDVGVDTIAAFEPGVREDGCGEYSPPVGVVVDALATYLTAFAWWTVLDQADAEAALDLTLEPAISTERR